MEESNYKNDKKTAKITNLLLDPNNYRFIDNKNYKEVSKDDVTSDFVQKRTLNFIVGDKHKGIEDLIKSYRANGFLAVDQIQVESLGDGKYRVLEGNRRIAALKVLYEDYQNQACDLGKLSSNIFSRVPIIVYEENTSGEHEIIMGLKHISGNKKWPPLNQAQLIFDLLHKYNWNEEDACESLGISKHELRRSLRTISLIKEFRLSDFGDQFETDMFGIFREIVASTDIKQWLNWDDNIKKPTNATNAERLYSWLSIVPEIRIDEDDEEITVERERIITKSTEVSTLAKIINDEAALIELEAKRNIADAYSASSSVGEDKYAKALANIEFNIEDAGSFIKYAQDEKKDKLVELKNKIEGLLVGQGHKDIVINKGIAKRILIDYKTNQFETITLSNFKGFRTDLLIKGLNRINIFAGENNVGKSSILEAIYLLANQNDLNALVELYRRRGKFINTLPALWLNSEFRNFNLKGVFDRKEVELNAHYYSEEDASIDKSDYLNTIELSSTFNGEQMLNSNARLFGNKAMEQYYQEIRSVCSTSFSSPFTLLGKELINEYHETSIKKGTYEKIIEFIHEFVDNRIIDIIKVGNVNQVRFLVKHSDFESPIDLTQFGEGVQRIFYISLQLASAQNGIMCIDEIENAIHHSLLVQFTKFIQIVAEEFNIQLFVTTHSIECIRAFVENGYKNEHLTGYRLIKSDEGVSYKAAKGEVLENQIQNFNLDIRG